MFFWKFDRQRGELKRCQIGSIADGSLWVILWECWFFETWSYEAEWGHFCENCYLKTDILFRGGYSVPRDTLSGIP